ncbi:MAG TPA: hypothetical protein VHO84_04815, partial [Syntrophorhabdaceae bacterium]|nr:hypothetical protein [Syntrophorhabdaceae bacterium]
KASAETGGTISPSGDVSAESGTNKTFAITASATHKISAVRVNGVSVGAVNSYTFSNLTANQTITATFVPRVYYTITASAGEGGTISPLGSASVESGTSTTYAIAPKNGYEIADVVVNGVSVGAVTSYTFTNVSANQSIAATFVDTRPGNSAVRVTSLSNMYTIRVSAGQGGTISPSDSVLVPSGEDKTFTIKAMNGYQIDTVYVNGTSVGAVKSYTFFDVSGNQTIEATFTLDLGKVSVVRLK